MRQHSFFAVAMVFLLATQASSQRKSNFSAHSDLVVLNVAVTDGRGAFVSGLGANDFRVLEDGRPQKVSFFAEQDAPATIGLLIDASGSMLENRNRVIAAITEFAKASNPADEFLPLVFNEQLTGVLPGQERFTQDPTVLRDALTHSLTARGRTAFHDALIEAVDGVSQGRHERKVLIVLSDGGDNASHRTFDEAFEKVLGSDVVIYSIALVDPLTLDRNPKALRRLSDGTGGLAFQPESPAVIAKVFQTIAHDIRSRYTLAYEPADISAASHLKHVRVIVNAPGYSGVKVRTRTGYVAMSSASNDGCEGGR